MSDSEYVRELAESWINGNKGTVLEEICLGNSAMLVAQIALKLSANKTGLRNDNTINFLEYIARNAGVE